VIAILWRDRALRAEAAYAILDDGSDLASFEAFKAAFGKDYVRLDAECETLTEAEQRLGVFEVVD